MNIVKYKYLFFALSLILIIPGLISLKIWGLKLGIDFSGGTLWELNFPEAQNVLSHDVRELLNQEGAEVSSTANTTEKSVIVRMRESDETKITSYKEKLKTKYGPVEDLSRQTVGPTISKELTKKAFQAVGLTILGIVLYVTWAFRKVPKPASSISFGVCTIVALVHDVIVVVGAFAFLGHFFNLEVDSLFITALLTVLGFSVHDTIVVFDRIRENLRKYSGESFENIVNHSLNQTLARSINTSLTVVFVLFALLLFGGESIKSFVLALLIGIISGTYSSIFNAAPLLVIWNKFIKR